MLRRYRHRRGLYAVTHDEKRRGTLRKVIWYVIFLFLLYWMGASLVRWFGGSGAVHSRSVTLTVEEGSRINASFDGGLLQPAESGVKLHVGDRVVAAAGTAILDFFDGTRIRLDEQADVTIQASEQGEETSTSAFLLSDGALWFRSPSLAVFSGTVIRSIITPAFSLQIPTDAEVVVEQDSVIVFSADGLGVTMKLTGHAEPFFIGEGQQLHLPNPSDVTGDPLRFRSAINPLAVQRTFIEDARRLAPRTENVRPTEINGTNDLLTVHAPEDGTQISERTVRIEGTVDARVDRVRVNGYLASINRTNGTFHQELSLRDGATETTIRVEALDARGVTIAEVSRTVRIVSESQSAATTADLTRPTITAPAETGQTYRTQADEIVIRGTAPAETQRIIVNDYQLQLYQPGNPTWSYLATTSLGNLTSGRNVYNVYAVNATGTRSAAASITILREAGATGVVSTDTAGDSVSASSAISEHQLPTNDPLAPGTLAVTRPVAGTSYVATGTGFLLEGTTSQQTASVWVNGYRLQLYTPGASFWNYIASVELGTLKPGTNTYRIVARNAQQQIVDSILYTVEFQP